MRGKALRIAVLAGGLGLLAGCYHDKHNVRVPTVEEYPLPPDEARFNNPPTENYRKPPPKKEEKTLLGGKGAGVGPGMPGGF